MSNLIKSFENKTSRLLSVGYRLMLLILDSIKIGRMAVYKAQAPNTLLVAKASNLKFLVNSSDMMVGFSTYINRVAFDSEKIGPLLSICGRGGGDSIMLDIGANIGTIGLTALAQGDVAEVWAFEPEPHNFSLLMSNIWLNGLNDGVRSFNVALTDKGDGSELEFELDTINFGDHRVRNTEQSGIYGEELRKVIRVKSARLDELCAELNYDKAIIWMDTQGHEGYVLRGSTALINKKIPIVTEFWPYGLKRSDCFDKFIDAIVSGPYTNIVDLNDKKVNLPCNKSTLLNIASHYGFEGRGTDILIY